MTDPFDQLVTLLTAEAAQHADGIEVQDRRGTGIIGISIYSLTPGQSPSAATAWMHDLDGLSIPEAIALVSDHAAGQGPAGY